MKQSLRVAYQGEPDAYSEAAALQFFSKHAPSTKLHFHPCATFQRIFEALSTGLVDRAAVPIENSLAGTLHQNLDLLLRFPSISIVGELDFRVHHCLLALPGSGIESVDVVRSHPMALAQCKAYLAANGLVGEEAYDTAGSAKLIRKEGADKAAAIASGRAAEIYGLTILEDGIEDDKRNYTRFLILSKESTTYVPKTPCKTSLVFSLINAPGILCRALSVFAVTGIDLAKIETRHIRTVREALCGADGNCDEESERRWGYVFYVDIARHAEDRAVANALTHLQEITTFYRVLGSYPQHCMQMHD